MKDEFRTYFDINKDSWNKKSPVHFTSDFYNVTGFKSGDLSLYHIELEELKEVRGKSILHLQSHFGLDTFSWERLGAKAVGIDFSEKSIELAEVLKVELGSNARFLCVNLYDLNENILDEQFDVIYSSYGAITWLPDLDEWAKIIFKYLKPGGIFYLVDFHPLLICFNHLESPHITTPYFTSKPIRKSYQGTYTNPDAAIEIIEYTWNHSISEILSSFVQNGFRIDFFHEFPYIPFKCFPNLERTPDGNYQMKDQPDIPLAFSLQTSKK